jgi:hypothetical protein
LVLILLALPGKKTVNQPERISMFERIKFSFLIILGILFLQPCRGRVDARELKTLVDSEISEVGLTTVNTSPAGKLPENVYISCDRYWILDQLPQTPARGLILNIDYHGILGDENEMIVLTRADSAQAWSRFTGYSVAAGNSAFDGTGSVHLNLKNLAQEREFALAHLLAGMQPNQPGNLSAAIKYGPVELSWDTQLELDASYFSVERRIESQEWVEIAKVEAAGLSAFPRQYRFEDISVFPGGTRLKYRVRQVTSQNKSAVSLPIELDYSPELRPSGFSQAILDPLAEVIHLKFSSSIGGHLRIDLFNAELEYQASLVEHEIIPGFYVYNIHPSRFEEKRLGGVAFCRLEIISFDHEKSFIQIRQVSTGRVF